MILKRIPKNFGRTLRLLTLLLSLVFCLTSMTGCPKSYVIVPGSETVTVTKQELDRVYSDNEALISALKTCKGIK